MERFVFLVILVALVGIVPGCAGEASERPKVPSDPAAEEEGRVELSESRPKPGPAQLWQPPPVWLIAEGKTMQASYGDFCEFDICMGAAPPKKMGKDLATLDVDAREEVLVVIGGNEFDDLSAGIRGWEHEPEGPSGPAALTEAGVPYDMRKMESREKPKGEEPAVSLLSGGGASTFELRSTGNPGDRLLSIFLKSRDGYNSAAYHVRLSPGEEGDNPPPEEKEFPGTVAEIKPDRDTEVYPQEEAARKLVASVETFPMEAPATRISAGEGYLWMLGAREAPNPQYPQEQYGPEGGIGNGVASGSLAAMAADEGVSPGGGTVLLKVDPGTGEVASSVSVPGSGGGVEVGAGTAWAAMENSVTRLDPETGQVVAEIPVGGYPTQLAPGKDGLWVTLHDDVQSGRVVRIDPATNEVAAEIETPGIAENLAVDGETGDVWAVALDQRQGFIDYAKNQLVRIDPAPDEISERFRVEGGVFGVAAGGGEVWVSNIEARLSKLDPERERVESIVTLDPNRGPYSMEIGAGSLWAASIDGAWRVDLESGRPLGSVEVEEYGAEDLAVDDGGSVWLTGMGKLTRITP